MGEQPNPWDLLQPQDVTSRHRGAKPPPSIWALGDQPVIPGYLLSFERRSFHTSAGSLCPSFLPARDVSLPVKRPLCHCTLKAGYQSARGHLWKPPLRFWRRPPQSNYPPNSVRASRVRPRTAKGPYFKDGSRTLACALEASGLSHIGWPRSMLSCSKGSRGLFRPIAGNRHLHRYYNFTGSWLRQRPDHSFVQVGTYPTREFRYLRTVIAWPPFTGASIQRFALQLTSLLTFRHQAGVRLYTSSLSSTACVFVKQLPGPIAPRVANGEDPYPEVTGSCLPSSNHESSKRLSMFYTTTCVRLQWCRTGLCFMDFLRVWLPIGLAWRTSISGSARHPDGSGASYTIQRAVPSAAAFHCSVRVLRAAVTGSWPYLPSPSPFGWGLGPDLPRDDWRCLGNLSSVGRGSPCRYLYLHLLCRDAPGGWPSPFYADGSTDTILSLILSAPPSASALYPIIIHARTLD